MTSRKIALCLGLMVSSLSAHAQQQQSEPQRQQTEEQKNDHTRQLQQRQQQQRQEQCGQYVPFNQYRVGVFSGCVDQIDSVKWDCLLHPREYCRGMSDKSAIADEFSACLQAFDLKIGNTKHPLAVSSAVFLDDLRHLEAWGMTNFSKESVTFGLALLRAQASPGDEKWAVAIECTVRGPFLVSVYQSSL